MSESIPNDYSIRSFLRPEADKAALALYRTIAWIAENDNPGDDAPVDTLAQYTSVMLVADLFALQPSMIAARVHWFRHYEKGKPT